jgi:hypothetical protein
MHAQNTNISCTLRLLIVYVITADAVVAQRRWWLLRSFLTGSHLDGEQYCLAYYISCVANVRLDACQSVWCARSGHTALQSHKYRFNSVLLIYC